MSSTQIFYVKTTVLLYLLIPTIFAVRHFSKNELNLYKKRVGKMFDYAYNGYLKYAYPLDELRPITCDGADTWGSYSLTLVDALDTLVVMGNYTEFRRVATLLQRTLDFDKDINVSVFETNIRIVGGLISAHLLSRRAGMLTEEGWPCSGPMLRMAEKVARKLLPAFDTKTGLPYGTVNLKYGVPEGETPITCTSGTATFIVEFGALSRLTGDPVFEKTAMRALNAMWKLRSEIGLVGNHIDVQTGRWTAVDSGIGAGVDSYFEYLVKGSVLFQIPELMTMYKEYDKSIEKYLKKEDWYLWGNMAKGTVTLPVFQSLDAFWPGMQSLVGDVDKAMKTVHNYHQVWKQFGFTPEFYNIPSGVVQNNREGYPLRPELIESVMYLYRATKDPFLLEVGVDILESIEHSTRTRCGYATVKDVRDHRLENRMESFFLSETTKYLYLLFDTENFIHNTGDHGTFIQTPSGECIVDAGGYVFNTEAHPIDPAALYCCSAEKHTHDAQLQHLHDNIDLLTLFDLNDVKEDVFEKAEKKMDEMNKKQEESVYKSIFEGKEADVVETKKEEVSGKEGMSVIVNDNKKNKNVQFTSSTLNDAIKMLQDSVGSQGMLQDTLAQTMNMLKKLTNVNVGNTLVESLTGTGEQQAKTDSLAVEVDKTGKVTTLPKEGASKTETLPSSEVEENPNSGDTDSGEKKEETLTVVTHGENGESSETVNIPLTEKQQMPTGAKGFGSGLTENNELASITEETSGESSATNQNSITEESDNSNSIINSESNNQKVDKTVISFNTKGETTILTVSRPENAKPSTITIAEDAASATVNCDAKSSTGDKNSSSSEEESSDIGSDDEISSSDKKRTVIDESRLFMCPARPFQARVSFRGEMFIQK